MKSTYVFDTMGTTIPEQSVKDLNEAFFKYAAQVGYTATEVEELKAMREKNPKDPEFLKRSGPGKVKLLENGLYSVELYNDVAPTFREIRKENSGIRIFTKGASDLVTAIYRQTGLLEVIGGSEQITSSTDFNAKDKTSSLCYDELRAFMNRKNEWVFCYVTDDVEEANAAMSHEHFTVAHICRPNQKNDGLDRRVAQLTRLEATLRLYSYYDGM